MKKFDQYVRHLRILSRAFDEDLTNDFIVSGIIDKYYIQFELGWKEKSGRTLCSSRILVGVEMNYKTAGQQSM